MTQTVRSHRHVCPRTWLRIKSFFLTVPGPAGNYSCLISSLENRVALPTPPEPESHLKLQLQRIWEMDSPDPQALKQRKLRGGGVGLMKLQLNW